MEILERTVIDSVKSPKDSNPTKPVLSPPKPITISEEKKNEERPMGRFICKSCNCGFDDRNEHRDHFKTDYHRYNLKRKTKNLQPITQEEFDSIEKADLENFFHELY